MLIERQIKHGHALNEWFKTRLGLVVAQEFATELEPSVDYLRGETLLQLGHCGDNLWLDKLNFNHKWIASPFSIPNQTQLVCSLNQMPIARNSVDCIVVPLAMEPFGNNYTLLDEIDRVLKPMGFVVFLSLNPWSLWGGAMKMGLLDCFDDRKVKMRSPFNLNRTWMQRGYTQCSLSHFCYLPPVTNKTLLQKLTFLDEVGKMIWPFPSGFYCFIAQKHQYISTRPIIIPVPKAYNPPMQPALTRIVARISEA